MCFEVTVPKVHGSISTIDRCLECPGIKIADKLLGRVALCISPMETILDKPNDEFFEVHPRFTRNLISFHQPNEHVVVM